jgi:hypothetical protein
MNDVRTLLARCQELGTTLTPGPDGKLKVQAPAPLPEELREALRQRKAEVLTVLAQRLLFPCPACGGPIQLDPSDEHLPTQFWTCQWCRAWGTTRAGAAYPVMWVSSSTGQ